jgi:lipoate---protein ligase
MKFLDLSFDRPAANLACDEALLEMMEKDPTCDDCLRVWEAKKHFVVLGHSNHLRSDANVGACHDDGIPILRRVSGGGTVLQGPGCFNYSLILKIGSPRLKNINETFAFVLDRHRGLIQHVCGAKVRVEGTSDLTLDGLKFSGNAQYRKSRFVLVHGTFLLNFDLRLIEKYLPIPGRQPAYRNGRPHLKFITNLRVDHALFCEHLKNVWAARTSFDDVPWARVDQLIENRYGRADWSEKF